MVPQSHLGDWIGPCRLWHPDPVVPVRSNGTITAVENGLRYGWAADGADQTGILELAGPAGSLRGDWRDTWHAPDGMVAHGCWSQGLLRLWSTYPAGDTTWGWRIEVDACDPEHLGLRMFNVVPGGPEQIAHDLRGHRPTASATR